MTPSELQDRGYLIVSEDSKLHRTFVKYRLHGEIADDGTRFWYPHFLVIIAEAVPAEVLLEQRDPDRRQPPISDEPFLILDADVSCNLIQRIGQDPDLESALYAVWAATSTQSWSQRINQLFAYLHSALPECLPDRNKWT